MTCLDDLTITNLVENTLPDAQRVAALAHLDECRTCSALVAAMAGGSTRAEAIPDRLPAGTEIGRYVVERVAGAGAMGVVYAARDPSLDRTIALKLVAASGDAHARERMVREAKAMALLSHRNVISIFDVGTFGDDVFLAMEYVPGRTLRQWLAEPRKPRAIVAALLEVARGLAAAHAAGIVHRDIKPDNVLVADDGRVCVTDFGLARASDEAIEVPPGDAPVTALTVTGHILGTPVYMAPEQLAGGAADARSDQFAFCVVAYECFAGKRPFEGRTLAELRESIARGAPPLAAPAWITRVIQRGLASDPDRRFSSMTALIDALDRDPAVRVRRIGIVAGAVAIAATTFLVTRGGDDKSTCPDPRERLAGAWDKARRAQLERAFGKKPYAYTAATVARVTSALDRYADEWATLRRDACRATYERREQTEARYDAQLACLERRRDELAAAVDVLANTDDETARHAVALVNGLADVRACGDPTKLVDQPLPADPATRAEVEAAFRTLASARALAKTSKLQASLASVNELLPRARSLAFAPLLAETLFLHGKLQMTTRDAATAERSLDEAAKLAATVKDDALAARVWTQLAYSVGTIARRFPDAARLAQFARTAVQRAGDTDELVIDWHNAVGATLAEEGKYPEALPHYRDALALAERATGPARAKLGDQLSKLAAVLDGAGQFAEARGVAERATQLFEQELGPDHPDLAFALDAYGAILYDAGEFAGSQKQYKRSLAILEKLGEPEAYTMTQAIEGIANAALALGDLAEARRQHERVLAIRERTGDKASSADSLINLGMVLVAQGDVAGGRANYERALAIYREAYGEKHPQVAVALRQRAQLEMGTPDAISDLEAARAIVVATGGDGHPEVGVIDGNLGAAYASLKKWREAEAHYARAVDNHVKTVGEKHEMVAMALTGQAQALLGQGKLDDGVKLLERALAIHEANGAPAPKRAIARWMIVRVLWDEDRERAQTLAKQVDAELGDAKDPTSLQIRADMQRLGVR